MEDQYEHCSTDYSRVRVSCEHSHDARINTDLIVAFATVESACNPTALGDEVSLKTAKKVPHKHIFGTKRVKRRGKWANVPAAWKSWGLYQFQYDRWVEEWRESVRLGQGGRKRADASDGQGVGELP
jgi:hypothetical protein